MISYAIQYSKPEFRARLVETIRALPFPKGAAVNVCICGGREFTDGRLLSGVMSFVRGQWTITTLLTGGAAGADRLGLMWADREGIPSRAIYARWKAQGKTAGPIRNGDLVSQLLTLENPLVVAMPGENGTADMIIKSRQAGIPVLDVQDVLDQAGTLDARRLIVS